VSTRRRGLRRVVAPLERFIEVEYASGIVLLAATLIALAWANSPFGASYHRLRDLTVPLPFGPELSQRSLQFWVNDGVMMIFFFVVGLEIRCELHDGALSERRAAALPLIAAIGGMLAPALLYLALARDAALLHGWAIPTATDIAFAVGIATLLAGSAPPAMRALLLALAIIDDIGAVLIIAWFYARHIDAVSLLIAAAVLALLWVLERSALRWGVNYLLGAPIVWWGFLHGGVHPALAGVALGLLVPPRARPGDGPGAQSPAARLERWFHPWVAYALMPLFALANAGIDLAGVSLDEPATRHLIAAIGAALLLGKPLGIWLATRIGLSLKWCRLPAGTTPRELLVIGALGGIGFTMSIFIANLAFTDPARLTAAKLGVLVGSAAAAIAALLLGRLATAPRDSG